MGGPAGGVKLFPVRLAPCAAGASTIPHGVVPGTSYRARHALRVPGWMASPIRPPRSSTARYEGMVKEVGRRVTWDGPPPSPSPPGLRPAATLRDRERKEKGKSGWMASPIRPPRSSTIPHGVVPGMSYRAVDVLRVSGWMASPIRPARSSTGRYEGIVKESGEVGRRGHGIGDTDPAFPCRRAVNAPPARRRRDRETKKRAGQDDPPRMDPVAGTARRPGGS